MFKLMSVDLELQMQSSNPNDSQKSESFIDKDCWWKELEFLDKNWQLLACDGSKRPINAQTGCLLSEWPSKCVPVDEFIKLPKEKIKAVGLALGSASGGILAVDFDAEGYEEIFESVFGKTLKDLPDTVAWTSGKPGRSQMAYKIDNKYWLKVRCLP